MMEKPVPMRRQRLRALRSVSVGLRLGGWCINYCCDTFSYRWSRGEGLHGFCHFIDAFLILTNEDKYKGIALFDPGKIGLDRTHPIGFHSEAVTEKLRPGDAVFHRLLEQGLNFGL